MEGTMEVKVLIEEPTYRMIEKIAMLEESSVQTWLEKAIYGRLEYGLEMEFADFVEYVLPEKREPLKLVG
jgi:hypothetical protein